MIADVKPTRGWHSKGHNWKGANRGGGVGITLKPRIQTELTYWLLQNKVTKNYYAYTLPRTEIHFFYPKKHKAAVYSSYDLMLRKAIEIRGRSWQRFFDIVKVRCSPNKLGDSRSRSSWKNRIESELVSNDG